MAGELSTSTLYISLSATGFAMVVRKLLSGHKLPRLVMEGLACEVCSGFWASLIVIVSTGGSGRYTLLASTAVAALLLRVYTRIDPGPTDWAEDPPEPGK